MTHRSDEAERGLPRSPKIIPEPPPLKPPVPEYKNGDDSSVGDRWWKQSDGCLEWRMASAINTAIHFLDYAYPEHAADILRKARADYLKSRP